MGGKGINYAPEITRLKVCYRGERVRYCALQSRSQVRVDQVALCLVLGAAKGNRIREQWGVKNEKGKNGSQRAREMGPEGERQASPKNG